MFPGDYSCHRIEMDGTKWLFVGGPWGFDSAADALDDVEDEEHPAPLGHAALNLTACDVDDESILDLLAGEEASYFAVGSIAHRDDSDALNFTEEGAFSTAKDALTHLRATGHEAIAAVFLDDVARNARALARGPARAEATERAESPGSG